MMAFGCYWEEDYDAWDINGDDGDLEFKCLVNDNVKIYIIESDTYKDIYKKIKDTVLVHLYINKLYFDLDKASRIANILTISFMGNNLLASWESYNASSVIGKVALFEFVIEVYKNDKGLFKYGYHTIGKGRVFRTDHLES